MEKKLVVEKNIEYRVRKIRERYVLIGASKCFEINSMGKHIWDDIDGERSVKEIINTIQNEYEVETSILEQDVCAFLETLLSIDAINVVN